MSFLLNDAFNELRVFENSGYFINGFYADASLLCNVIDGCHSQFFDGMNAHSVQHVVRCSADHEQVRVQKICMEYRQGAARNGRILFTEKTDVGMFTVLRERRYLFFTNIIL